MTRGAGRRGGALLLALLLVIVLEGLAALTLSAAISRGRLVVAARDAVEGRAVAEHALAAVRVDQEDALRTLADGATLEVTVASPVAAWEVAVAARRVGSVVRLVAEARRILSDGRPAAAQRATLLLRRIGADTLRVISP